jgi:hypothetical protein
MTAVSQTELKSLDDAHRLNQELAALQAREEFPPRWVRIAKRVTLMLLLAAALLSFYLLDKMQEAVSLLK